jgi:cell division protein FtsB
MKIFVIIILSIVLSAILVQSYLIVKERNQLKTSLDNLNSRFEALSKENTDLQSEIEYFSHPENLEKELRLRFNYKKPDEKMMIIVP